MPPKALTGQAGTIYLLHFQEPYKHARHYLGWTGEPLDKRLQAHAVGRGSRLMAVVGEAGIPWRLARVWENVDRHVERAMKERKMTPRLCPLCVRDTPTRGKHGGLTELKPSTLAALERLRQTYPRWVVVARHGREQVANQCICPGGEAGGHSHDCRFGQVAA